MSDATNYYEVLGVERSASTDAIKRAYRKLAQTFHPDINKDPAAEARFKEIAEANDVLSNPELRKKYDAFGADFRHVPDDIDPEEWARSQRAGAGARRPPRAQSHADEQAFQDFIEDLFREQSSARRSRGPIPGADQRASISLSLDDAFHASRRSLTLDGPTGTRTIEVNIPAGVINGQTMRIPGKGGRGSEGAPAGDLYLHVTIEPDPRYRLTGRDIEVDLPLAPWEAALGATIPVTGPGGTTTIKVSPGTSTGTRLRIRGQGVPKPGKPGDLYARVQIVVPKAPTQEEQDLYSQLAEISDFDPRSNS